MKIENLNKTLSLENDGGLSFFFVGVGSAFAKTHFQNLGNTILTPEFHFQEVEYENLDTKREF